MNKAVLELLLRLKDEASAQLRQVQASLTGLGGALQGVVTGGLVAGAAAVGAFGASSITAAADFEAGMNRFASVAGGALSAAGLQLSDFQAKFLELGAATQFSAAQAQEAAIALAKGGVPVTDILGEATQATLDLAAAGELELAPAADIVAKQLGVWAETGVTAGQVANLLAQAANASTVDVDELALGLANVGGSAKVAGVDFQDLVQTMALIAPGFSSASDAGTSLKTMISRLIPTTNDAKAAMSELGLMFTSTTKIADFLRQHGIEPIGDDLDALGNQFTEWATAQGWTVKEIAKAWDSFGQSKFFDMDGNFVGMAQAAQLLQDATKDLSEEEKLLAFNTIFGADAIRAAAAVANAGAAGFNQMGADMAAAGSAAEQAAARNQGFKFALDSLLGSIETLQIILGGALLPVLTAFINTALIPGVNWFTTFAQTVLGSANPLATLVAQITAVVPGFSQFLAAAQPLAALLQANLIPILVGVGAVLAGVVVSALVSAAAAFLATIAPILVVVAVVAALYAAWQSNFMGIQTITATVLAAVQMVVQAVLAQVLAFWQANGASILATAQQAWTMLGTIVQTALVLIQGIVMGMLALVLGFIQDHGAQIHQVLTNAWTIISSLIAATLALIQGVLQAALAIFQGDWQAAWTAIQTMSVTITQAIGSIIVAALDTIAAFFGTSLDGIKSQWESNFGALAQIAESLMARAREAIQPALDGISGAFGAIKGAIDSAVEAVRRFIDAAANISVPDILTPGSPTPFELGIRGISAALNEAATGALPRFSAEAAALPAGAAQPLAAPAGGGSGGRGGDTYTYTITIPITYSGGVGRDLEFERRVEAVVERALREVGRTADMRRRAGR